MAIAACVIIAIVIIGVFITVWICMYYYGETKTGPFEESRRKERIEELEKEIRILKGGGDQ